MLGKSRVPVGLIATQDFARRAVAALDFFKLPANMWPFGLDLLHRGQMMQRRQIDLHTATAEAFVHAIYLKIRNLPDMVLYADSFEHGIASTYVFKMWLAVVEDPNTCERITVRLHDKLDKGDQAALRSAVRETSWMPRALGAAIILHGEEEHLTIRYVSHTNGGFIVQLGLT